MPENPVHPSHYRVRLHDGREVECIEIIEALGLNFNLGNALKYLWRSGRKSGEAKLISLSKCEYYVEREITTEIEGVAAEVSAEQDDARASFDALCATFRGEVAP